MNWTFQECMARPIDIRHPKVANQLYWWSHRGIFVENVLDRDMVHALAWLPIKMFTTSVMEAAVDCWSWAIVGRPELELLVSSEVGRSGFCHCQSRSCRKFIKFGRGSSVTRRVCIPLINPYRRRSLHRKRNNLNRNHHRFSLIEPSSKCVPFSTIIAFSHRHLLFFSLSKSESICACTSPMSKWKCW